MSENRSPEAIREANEVLLALIIAVSVAVLVAIFVCAMGWNRHCPEPPDPCAEQERGHQVIVDGVPFGCTGDSTNFRG